MKLHFLACMGVLVSGPAAAQAPTVLAVVPIAAQAANRAVLRTGTEVPLRLVEGLTTQGKLLRVGQRVRLETAEPIIVQGVNVVPAGSPAMGEITDVRNKGMWGKSGHLAGRVLYLTVNGRQVHLSGAFDDKGVVGGVGAVAVSAIIFAPAGFFMTGTSAKLPVGTIVKAFVDEDVPLDIAVTAPLPVIVSAPVAPAAAIVKASAVIVTPISK